MPDWSMNEAAIRAGHKPYDPDSEWQPVRLAALDVVVALHDPSTIDFAIARIECVANAGKIIRVRPTTKMPPCNAKRGFEIHPDDRHIMMGSPKYICEHEILAD